MGTADLLKDRFSAIPLCHATYRQPKGRVAHAAQPLGSRQRQEPSPSAHYPYKSLVNKLIDCHKATTWHAIRFRMEHAG